MASKLLMDNPKEVKFAPANADFEGLTGESISADWYNEQFAGELGQKYNAEVLREACVGITNEYTSESKEPYIVHLFPLRCQAVKADCVKQLISSHFFGFHSHLTHLIVEEKNIIFILKTLSMANKILEFQHIRLMGWFATMPRLKCVTTVVVRNIGLDIDLAKLTDELKANKAIPEVLEVSRMQRAIRTNKKNKLAQPIESLKITFKGEEAPDKIEICGKSCDAMPFKAQIKRCTHCQYYGHFTKSCTNSPRCNFCGKNHLTNQCSNQNKKRFRCVNCEGGHKASDTNCPEYKKQLGITKIMDEMQLSFPQARDYYLDRYPSEDSDSDFDSDNAAMLYQMALLQEVMGEYDADDLFDMYDPYDSDDYDGYDYDDYDIAF